MKKAFTMIELIFVIVIIGILVAVAIPKLSATRNDANAAKSVMNLSIAVSNAGSQYTSQSNFDGLPTILKCFRLTYSNEGNLTIITADDANYCTLSNSVASKNNLIGTHVFGGKQVSF